MIIGRENFPVFRSVATQPPIPGWEGAENMDRIRPHLPLCDGNVILLGKISKKLLHPSLPFALQHVAPVLGRPDQGGEGLVDGLGCTSENHAAIVRP
jgi:hypothetical protein